MDSEYSHQRWLEETVDEENSTKDLFSAITTNVLLFFLIFGLSATVEVKNLKKQLTNKAAIFAGVAMQFLIMPFLGFISIFMLRNAPGFSQAMSITLLVVTSSPGGTFSNWWCSLFNAELALSVAMTSVSSILSVALLPANLLFYSWASNKVNKRSEDESVDIVQSLDFPSLFITLGVVLGGILVGLFASYVYDNPNFHKRANGFGSICGLVLVLFSLFLGSGNGGSDTNFWSLPWSFYLGTALPCIAGLLLANIFSRCLRLDTKETVTIAIECCYQNTGIAISVAATMFTDPTERTEAISVPLFFGVIQSVVIGMYCLWAWKSNWTKAPPNEKLCVVLTKSYECEDEEEMELDVDNETKRGWLAGLFVPRARSEQSSDKGTNLSATLGEAKREKPALRSRIDSTDVTVATERSRVDSVDASISVTPPQTPIRLQEERLAHEDMNDIESQLFQTSLASVPVLAPLSEEMRHTDSSDSFQEPTPRSHSPKPEQDEEAL